MAVQNSLDRLESDQQTFFTECKENKQKEWRDSQFDKLRGEYNKILEEADDKVSSRAPYFSLVTNLHLFNKFYIFLSFLIQSQPHLVIPFD